MKHGLSLLNTMSRLVPMLALMLYAPNALAQGNAKLFEEWSVDLPMDPIKNADGRFYTKGKIIWSSWGDYIDGIIKYRFYDNMEEATNYMHRPTFSDMGEFCFSRGTYDFSVGKCVPGGDYSGAVYSRNYWSKIEGENVFNGVGVCTSTCYSIPEYFTGPSPHLACPIGSSSTWDDFGSIRCVTPPVVDRFGDKYDVCDSGGKGSGNFGNPIYPANGTKRDFLQLGIILNGIYGIHYDTKRKSPSNFRSSQLDAPNFSPSFGDLWASSVHKRLVFSYLASQSSVQVYRGSNYQFSFLQDKSNWLYYKPSSDVKDRLTKLATGGWLYFDHQTGGQEFYSEDGLLQKSTKHGGGSLLYTYSTASTPSEVAPSPGLLIRVVDSFGRAVDFHYQQPADSALKPRIYKVISSGSGDISVGYDASGNLETVTWPDQTTKQFIYDDPALPWALTGIRDEAQKRISTYGYTPSGLANQTQGAGGVNSYAATWTTEPRWNVALTWDPQLGIYWRDITWVPPELPQITDPYGNNISITTQLVQGMVRISGQSQPAGSGCNAAFSKWDFDDNANITNRVDFSGRRTCSAYDSSRNLETTRLEGLIDDPLADPALNTCPADLLSYTIPANLPPEKAQRKTHTQWHPVWHLKTREAEPKRITTWVYNGQPDPLNNNAVASCAPADALLPDGSKIAVLCKRYEQATADETGNLGFAAAALSTRSWSTTYNQHGQVLTETDPRGKTTNYEYWADTSFPAGDNNPAGEARGHTLGDLKVVTRPGNQVSRHTHYNKRGQVLRTELPNGGVEEREYHLRGWLTKVKKRASATATSSQDTQYDYYPTGLLKQVTQADGSWQLYLYDDAHRLTDVSDSLGNKVKYTLDNAGNAKQEDHTDPTGVLVKTISRTFDTLGRLQSQKLGAP